MSIRLGEMLLNEGVLTHEELDQVLAAQAIYGGRLGTNLVEMGLVQEEQLVRLLNQKLGIPCIDHSALDELSGELLAVIPQELVQRFRVLPIAREGRRLTVAMADPTDYRAIEEIGFVTGLVIVPRVCTELRLALALERYFGMKRPMRYIPVTNGFRSRNLDRLNGESVEEAASSAEGSAACLAGADRGEVVVELGQEIVHEVDAEAAAGEAGADPFWGPERSGADWAEGSGVCSEQEASAAAVACADSDSDSGAGPDTWPESVVAAREASVAEQIAEVLTEGDLVRIVVAHLGVRFENGGIARCSDGKAVGLEAVAGGTPVAGFRGCAVSIESSDLIRQVLQRGEPYLGRYGHAGPEAKLLEQAGVKPGAPLLLFPVVVGARGVGFIFAQGSKGRLGPAGLELKRLADKSSQALEMLRLKKRIREE